MSATDARLVSLHLALHRLGGAEPKLSFLNVKNVLYVLTCRLYSLFSFSKMERAHYKLRPTNNNQTAWSDQPYVGLF